MSEIFKSYQRALAAAGFDPGPIDGIPGPQTEKATKAFQIARGLDVDGIIGKQTRTALGVAIPPLLPAAAGAPDEPAWLVNARGYLGMREIVGPKHNPRVVALWEKAHVPGVNDDETAWCAAFVSAVLEEVEIRSKRTGWARGYLSWGQKIGAPCVGAIVVFERGPKYGHVGIVVGRDRNGNLMVLGGNQSNAVTIASFSRSRVLGYRWPPGFDPSGNYSLPVIDSNGRLSSNEA